MIRIIRKSRAVIWLAIAGSILAGCGSENAAAPTTPLAVTSPAATAPASGSSKEATPPGQVNAGSASASGSGAASTPATDSKATGAAAGGTQTGPNASGTGAGVTGAGGAGKGSDSPAKPSAGAGTTTKPPTGADAATKPGQTSPAQPPVKAPAQDPAAPPAQPKGASVQVVAKPESIAVLVNKQNALPESYEPQDLVYPDVAFIFSEKIDKRKMRKEAATALEALFKGAKKDGISLAGVSAYRSFATQKTLFNNYVKQDGEEKARTYSAVPGHSEHETGLAIDVTGSNGKCAAQNCFAGTKEAAWLDGHASEYGFIIRYPKGKESITGYQYEPWHLRYVGTQLSEEIASKGVTLEEYFNAVPVTK
jgi:D-alanyl-D-alanine carboxypeptidase